MSGRLQEINERFKNTSYGDWKVYENDEGTCIGTVGDHPQLKGPAPVVTMATSWKDGIHKKVYISKENADFIANSKRDVRWLIEQAKQTESFKKLHKSYLDRYVDSVGEINRLREENYQLRIKYENTGTMMDRAALRSENRKLREALEFYAGESHYEMWQERDGNPQTNEWTNDVTYDSGETAKKALEDSK